MQVPFSIVNQYALNDFEAAFYKDSLGPISLDALCSHITLCAEMGRRESDLVNNMIISEKMYLEAEKKFFKNEKYIGYGLDLYKYLLKHKKRISKLEEMLSFNDLNKLFGRIYINTQKHTPPTSVISYYSYYRIEIILFVSIFWLCKTSVSRIEFPSIQSNVITFSLVKFQ